jgi:hypothetical protein
MNSCVASCPATTGGSSQQASPSSPTNGCAPFSPRESPCSISPKRINSAKLNTWRGCVYAGARDRARWRAPLRGGRFALAEQSSAANRRSMRLCRPRPPRWQGDAGVDFIEVFRPEWSYRCVSVNSGGSAGGGNQISEARRAGAARLSARGHDAVRSEPGHGDPHARPQAPGTVSKKIRRLTQCGRFGENGRGFAPDQQGLRWHAENKMMRSVVPIPMSIHAEAHPGCTQ